MKRKLRTIIPTLIFIAVIIYILPLIYSELVLNTAHEYPEDEFLETASDKKAIIGLKEFIGIDMNFRYAPVEKPYMSIPYSEFG